MPDSHVGMFHSHVHNSGVYLSGTDCHGTIHTQSLYEGEYFLSGVMCTASKKWGMMRIKDTKAAAQQKKENAKKKL